MGSRLRLLAATTLVAVAGGIGVLHNEEVAKTPESAGQPDCQEIVFENRKFTECIAIPHRHRIMTKITGSNGIIYRGFAALKEDIEEDDVAFAMNGGMYDIGSRPIGYYVESGERLYPLNRKDGEGNFYLKPNGVFFGESDGNWRIMTSNDFAEKVESRPEFGTQSGPMLLMNGQLHPGISANGKSEKIRNAVGIDKEGRAHFVISDQPVSFGLLSRMMLDHAKTANALYLDGTVSGLWYPPTHRMDANYPLGPLIVVLNSKKS